MVTLPFPADSGHRTRCTTYVRESPPCVARTVHVNWLPLEFMTKLKVPVLFASLASRKVPLAVLPAVVPSSGPPSVSVLRAPDDAL